MAEKLLITGGTGTVGGALLEHLSDRGIDVKVGTRRPDRAIEMLPEGVELVELDYDVTETWDEAVQWADRLFLVPPHFDPKADDRLVPFLDWAVQSGVRHIVLVSGIGIEARERLALRRLEQRVERTGVAYTFLRPNIYMQNFSRPFMAGQIRQEGAFRLSAGEGRVSFVDARDVAAIAAEALTDDAHQGKSYALTGPSALDHHEVAEIISQAAGREIRYEPIRDEAMRRELREAGWREDRADMFADLLASVAMGERGDVTPDVERLLGRPPTAFRAFAREHARSWTLGRAGVH